MYRDWKQKPNSNVIGKIIKLWDVNVNKSEDVLVERQKTTSLGLEGQQLYQPKNEKNYKTRITPRCFFLQSGKKEDCKTSF